MYRSSSSSCSVEVSALEVGSAEEGFMNTVDAVAVKSEVYEKPDE